MIGEHGYLYLLKKLVLLGEDRPDRTGVGTIGLFGEQLRFDLAKGFPLLTTKKVHFKSVVEELLWFLRGETNIRSLNASIWDEWADEQGELGPIYGKQWRRWFVSRWNENGWVGSETIDQIANLVEGLKKDAFGRRHIVSAWNPGEIDQMALPPCHILFQMYVSATGKLSCHLYQRSADVFLGVPFNIASYAMLTMMVAQVTGLDLGELIISFGDVHLYKNHVDQALLQGTRTPMAPPKLVLAKKNDIFAFQTGDFTLVDYNPMPAIAAAVAV